MIQYTDIKPSALERAMTQAREDVRGEVEVRHEPVVANPDIVPRQIEENVFTMDTYEVYQIVKRTLAFYARWPDEHSLTIATLWVISTWFADVEGNLLFKTHPRIFFIAPKGSGKTQMMEIMQALVRNPTGILSGPMATAPFIREALSAKHTVFLDEYDRNASNKWVQVLVGAYKASAGAGNARGGYNAQNVFGPMILGAKPALLTSANGKLIEDLIERAFTITPKKHVGKIDPRTGKKDKVPRLDEDFYINAEIIRALLEIWGESVRPEPGKQLWDIHGVPESLDGRMAELAVPLLAVADRAIDPERLTSKKYKYQDLRVAIEAREAIENMLLGRGNNGAELVADIKNRLTRLGIEV